MLLFGQNKPNIVLIYGDNIGIGEIYSYGGVRGVPTPNIDRLGKEGIRLTNFNVEYTCIPSRISMLTGRYAMRTGEDYFSGITLWENTIADVLKPAGYATALYGKWDLSGENWQGRREPTQQGFDEWYGIPGTSTVSQFTSMAGFPKDEERPGIFSGVVGSKSKKVKVFDIEARRVIDRECANKGINFINRNVKEKKPFFLCFPMTQLHFPALPHPDKMGSTGAGDMGDAVADMDYNVGLILDEIDRLGIAKNTIVIWCGDNGAEMRRPWRGTPGPWRGFYNSAAEGGVRSPCLIRWPGIFPEGRVSDEIFHQVDLFTTIANISGVKDIGQKDRIIDGVNQLPFLKGQQTHSERESCIFLNRKGEVMAVKWRNWKFWYNYRTELPDATPDNLVRLFDLKVDPQEEIDVKNFYPWVIGVMDSIVRTYELSLIDFPLVPASANLEEPYVPKSAGVGKLKPSYKRQDRDQVIKRSEALEKPNFSGSWSTNELSIVSVINQFDNQKVPSLGSGLGDRITLHHTQDLLAIENVYFIPREMQEIMRQEFSLSGKPSENTMNIGREQNPSLSTTTWDGNRLIIQSKLPYYDSKEKKQNYSTVYYTIWLEKPKSTPWEPRLIVETKREGIKEGLTVTNQTAYTKGYR